jgi:hypothetical protein
MKVRTDKGETKFSQDSAEEADFFLEKIMAYAISGIGLCLILLKLVSSH